MESSTLSEGPDVEVQRRYRSRGQSHNPYAPLLAALRQLIVRFLEKGAVMSRQTTEELKTANRFAAQADANSNYEKIKALAYQLWVERGSPVGSPEQDWYRAEAQLNQRGSAQRAA